jgi:phage-related protein
MDSMKTFLSNIWENIKSAVSQKITEIKDTIVNGFNIAVDFIKNLASQAFSWGADIINGIVNGIRSCIQNVADAVTGVADTIRSFLHFSVPDEGPLADFESWMPDFMQGLAVGITNNQGIVEEKIVQFTVSIMEKIRETLAQVWNQTGTAVRTALENIKSIIAESWTGISEIIRSSFSSVQTCVSAV